MTFAVRRRVLAGPITSFTIVLCLVLTGCSSAPTKSSTSLSHTLAVATLQALQIADPDRFDIPAGHTVFAETLTAGLVRYKVPAAGQLPSATQVVGDLAKSWTIAPDGITFVLRDAKSEYGNPLTAADVQYSFVRGAAMHDSAVNSFQGKAGINQADPITIIDDHTVKLNAKVNSITLPMLCFFQTGAILDSTEVKKHVTADDPLAKTWLATHSATFGPYALDSLNPGIEEDLKVNPNWWGGTPYFTKVQIRTVPDASTRLLLLTSGQVDVAMELTAQQLSSLAGNSSYSAPKTPIGSQVEMQLDLYANPPLNDPNVREAISLAIDRKALIQGPFAGYGLVPVGYWSQALPQQQPLPPPFAYDPTMAKQLLTQAGYPNGFNLVGEYTAGSSNDGADAASLFTLLGQQLAAVGITVTQDPVQQAQFTPDVRAHKDGFVAFDVGAFVYDPAYVANQLFTKDAFNNVYYVGYFNGQEPKADMLAKQALAMPIGSARDAVLAQLNQTLRDDSAPLFPLIDAVNSNAYKAGICGTNAASFGGQSILIRDLTAC